MEELQRILRVADQICSGYSKLAGEFELKARFLNLVILLLSTWLVAMAFVGPAIGAELAPFHLKPELWIGFLAVGTFALTLIEGRIAWKVRADVYRRAKSRYGDFVLDLRRALSGQEAIPEAEVRRLVQKYQAMAEFVEPLPENQFLKLKQYHLRKVEISKYLDSHPSANIFLLKIRLWWRDNCGSKESGRDE